MSTHPSEYSPSTPYYPREYYPAHMAADSSGYLRDRTRGMWVSTLRVPRVSTHSPREDPVVSPPGLAHSVHGVYFQGTRRVLAGYSSEYSRVLAGYSLGTLRVLSGCSRGTLSTDGGRPVGDDDREALVHDEHRRVPVSQIP